MHIIEQQFGLVHDCMRACVYADYINRNAPQGGAWESIKDMCYSDAIISWANIFGTDKEKTHWKKLVENFRFVNFDKIKVFSREMIVTYLDISEAEWVSFWKLVIKTRNKRVAHIDTEVRIENLPNITWLLQSAYLYREWLIELLKLGQRRGFAIKITEQSSTSVLEKFRSEIANIVN